MPRIDFFEDGNKQITQKEVFGLRDDKKNQPAYIDEDLSNKEKWLGTVYNDNGKVVAFYPVDNCIEMKRKEDPNNYASRCEGILRYEVNNLIFTELKDRNLDKAQIWRKQAKSQILETLRYFFDNYDKNSFKIKAWICNKKQLVNADYSIQIQHFKRCTEEEFGIANGINLYIQREIHI